MKTLKQVLSENKNKKRLIKAVLSNIDYEYIPDILEVGMSSGFGNFIYYKDTLNFFNKYKRDILALVIEVSDSLDSNLLEMISNFKSLDKQFSEMEISEAIFLEKGEYSYIIKNALVWFAVEEICHLFEE